MDKIISNTYSKKAKSMENATVLFCFFSFEGVFSLFLMYLSNRVKKLLRMIKIDTAHLFNLRT